MTTALIQRKVPWTRQPSGPVEVNRSIFKASSDLRHRGLIRPWIGPVGFDPYVDWTITGTPTKVTTPAGLSYQFGTDISLNSPCLIAGNSTGTQTFRNFTIVVVASWASNASSDTAASIGTSKADGGPDLLFQNNSGTLRVYNGGYTNVESTVLGKPYCLVMTYNEDGSSYTRQVFVNGRLIRTRTGYSAHVGDLWLGDGFPGNSPDNRLLASYHQVGVGCNLSDAAALRLSANPWSLFQPQTQHIPIEYGAAPAGFEPQWAYGSNHIIYGGTL